VNGIRFTLVCDGSSDRALIHPIRWALHRRGLLIERGAWADLSFTRPQPKTLRDRVHASIENYPCDLLFVHRDAEKDPVSVRLEEVRAAVEDVAERHVPVIPVRMTEAWLLHDEGAIRAASGNPNGAVRLTLPSPQHVESLPDPKNVLFAALLAATDLAGHRRKKKQRELPRMRARVAELIDDYEPLLKAPGFQRFVDDIDIALQNI
jgi:hypothetical protein